MDSRLQKLKRALEKALEGMSSEQLSWHHPSKWSPAEVLEHLYLTYTGTIKGFEEVEKAGKPLATRVSIRQRWRAWMVIGFNYLPPGRKAPARTMPKGLPADKVRNEIGKKIVALDEIIAQCEARFGRRVRLLDHPILGPFTALQWRKFHLLHGLHHIRQILRLREDMKRTK